MNVRSFFGVFAFLGLVLGVLEFLLFYVYQAGIFEGYNGEAGMDWNALWGTFGGLWSFIALVVGLVLIGGLLATAGYLAHRRYVIRAVGLAALILVVGLLMRQFVNWEDIDWLGVWNVVWPILAWIGGTTAVTLGAIAIHERLRG